MLYLKLGLGLVCIVLVVDLYILIHRWIPSIPPLILGIGLLIFVWPCLTFNTIFPAFYIHLLFFLLLTQGIFFLFKRPVNLFLFLIPLILTIAIIGFGIYNIQHVKKTEYTVTTSKTVPETRIVMISDLHYPTGLNQKSIQNMVKTLKAQQPSFYVLNGDIVDEFTTEYQMKNVFYELGKLSQTAPVYYVFGNHDNQHYSSKPAFSKKELKEEIEKNDIQVLQDQVIHLQGISLIGREDEEVKDRMSLDDLVAQCPAKNYKIVIDHQPTDLLLCHQLGIDLQISGHTHAGQIFPLGILAEISGAIDHNYGILKKGDFTQITSSGVNGWGFPLRTQGQSEYVVISLTSN